MPLAPRGPNVPVPAPAPSDPERMCLECRQHAQRPAPSRQRQRLQAEQQESGGHGHTNLCKPQVPLELPELCSQGFQPPPSLFMGLSCDAPGPTILLFPFCPSLGVASAPAGTVEGWGQGREELSLRGSKTLDAPARKNSQGGPCFQFNPLGWESFGSHLLLGG